MRARWNIALPLLLPLALATTTVRAQEDLRDEAKGHVTLGNVEYRRGHYREALEEFRKAYDAAPLPELLYNVARCEDQLGDAVAATRDYQRYLAVRPGADDAEEIRARVRALAETHAPPPATARPPSTGAAPATAPRPASGPTAASPPDAPTSTAPPAAPAPAPSPPGTSPPAPSPPAPSVPARPTVPLVATPTEAAPPAPRSRAWVGVVAAVAAVVVAGAAIGLGVALTTPVSPIAGNTTPGYTTINP